MDDRGDFVAWHNSKIGIFLVKSAYYGEWNHKFRRSYANDQGIGRAGDREVWRNLWTSTVAPKVKFLAAEHSKNRSRVLVY